MRVKLVMKSSWLGIGIRAGSVYLEQINATFEHLLSLIISFRQSPTPNVHLMKPRI
jgi:hypothetical protein